MTLIVALIGAQIYELEIISPIFGICIKGMTTYVIDYRITLHDFTLN